MMIRRVWTKTIGKNASIAITARGKRRVTLPNCSACARLRLLRRAEHLLVLGFSSFDRALQGFRGRRCGLASMYPAFDWSITNYQGNHRLIEEESKPGATSE